MKLNVVVLVMVALAALAPTARAVILTGNLTITPVLVAIEWLAYGKTALELRPQVRACLRVCCLRVVGLLFWGGEGTVVVRTAHNQHTNTTT